MGLVFAGLLAWAAFEFASLPDADDLASKNPETTALIQARGAEATAARRTPKRQQLWVPLAGVAPWAVDAVVVSEDAGFYLHHGVDLDELKKVVTEAWDKRKLRRGASTITMQLARNLWLSADRSLARKVKELILARRLEDALPKKRILTLYLNVAEWGDGVYGIEAAARTYYGVSARQLTLAQAAILAAMLPAPLRWIPDRHPPVLRRRALRIIDLLEQYGKIRADPSELARQEIQAIFGEPRQPTTEPDDENPEDER